MNLDLSYYFAIFLRRIHYFIITTALVSAASLAAALLLPSVYVAESLLVVESSQIPGQLIPPTVQAAAMEKLQIVENRLMTRQNLLDIANRLNVFKDIKKMSPDEIVTEMRDNTSIQNSAIRGEATTMYLAFTAETGNIAAGVVNEYVTVILNADAEMRTKGAEGTVDFFRQQVKSLNVQLDQMSAQILDFQNSNSDALPSTLAYRLTQQTGLQNSVDVAIQDIKQLQDQKDRLIAIYNATGLVTNNPSLQTPEAQQLKQLNDQLQQALAVLSSTHPKVLMLNAQIAQLETIVTSQTTSNSTVVNTNPTASIYDAQIADIDSRIKVAEQARDQVTEQLKILQDTIDRTPANQIALDALNRDYSNLQQQYNNAVSGLSQAEASVQVELSSKGEKISVLDAATPPNRPAKPNRALIGIGGTIAGMGLGLGIIILLELLNRSVRRPKDIIQSFGITPIVTIPYLRTPNETMRRRSAFVGLLLLAVIGIPAAIYAVHVFYEPLDILLNRIMTKFGIRL
jgi:polysaccharide chain length determinant protein (PEP-CTERM system associated)